MLLHARTVRTSACLVLTIGRRRRGELRVGRRSLRVRMGVLREMERVMRGCYLSWRTVVQAMPALMRWIGFPYLRSGRPLLLRMRERSETWWRYTLRWCIQCKLPVISFSVFTLSLRIFFTIVLFWGICISPYRFGAVLDPSLYLDSIFEYNTSSSYTAVAKSHIGGDSNKD